MKKLIIFALLTCFMALESYSQDNDSDWKFGGQLQLRSELDGRGFSHDDRALGFTSMRTRVFVSKNFENKVGLFVQFQDSRIFGSEINTLTSSSNVDIHQAYVTLTNPLDIPISVKAGRFELSYGTQRFLGAVGWHYVARSFDGAIISFDPGVKVDLFAVTHSNNQGYIGNPNPGTSQNPGPYSNITDDQSYGIYGFWATKAINDDHSVDLFTYYELNNHKTNGKNVDLARATLGLNYLGSFGDLSTIVEAAYQTGSTGVYDVAAYLLSLSAKYKINTVSVGAGFDMLSGTAPMGSEEYNTFAPSFGTNHKFYGYMDYFINLPVNTYNLGLRDINFGLNWSPDDCKLSFDGRFHLFTSDQETSNGDNSFGNEIDLTIKYKFVKGTTIVWGGSMFMPGDIFKATFSADGSKEDTGYWTYLMVVTNL